MGIYNCAGTLPEAIDSILAQTYTNWELILCDDGSADNTCAVAESYRQRFPEKIILLQNERNMGLNFTLNRCLSQANGEFIARMDGDDLCSADRFEKEIRVLLDNPQVAVVGSQTIHFDEAGIWGTGNHKTFPQKEDLVSGPPFTHATCMMRRSIIEKIGGYTEDPKYLRVEDFDLWVKLYAAGYRGMNLNESLYYFRDDRNAISRRKFRYRINEARVICKAIRLLKLPIWNYIYAFRPIIIGLLPTWLYELLHRLRHKT